MIKIILKTYPFLLKKTFEIGESHKFTHTVTLFIDANPKYIIIRPFQELA